MSNNPYLYILVRKDLDSLNPGKAVAHGAHAASQFVYKTMCQISTGTLDTDHDIMFDKWVKSADGFGTKITLHVTLRELQTAVAVAKSMDFLANETIDPTYPYILHREYAKLINHAEQVSPTTIGNCATSLTNDPVDIGKGNMLCLREETTAAYIFGDKSALKPIVGNFPMMP